MYQEFFGFDRRPFPTHGAPPPFIPTPATDEALHALERCARQAGGIGILSAPPGTGKTAVALETGRRLSDILHVVYLSSSNYTSRRGLLQAILFELGVDYAGLTEHEARLHVIEFARGLPPEKDGLVLLVDEADQLSERLLEELRTLADYMHEGRALLRLVLCGQLGLDERLAAPELDAFNQRVGCHVVLETLDRRQSADYVRETLAACGSRLEEVFSAEALDLICVASDGNIRCLHHLCDHALLLAFVAEEKPVSSATVRAALEDLQGLPLTWNVPAPARPESDTDLELEPVDEPIELHDDEERESAMTPPETSSSNLEFTTSTIPAVDETQTTVIEFGGDPQQAPPASGQLEPRVDFCRSPMEDPIPAAESHSDSREYRLEDRYAQLDRQAELEQLQATTSGAVLESDGNDRAEDDAGVVEPDRRAEISLPDTAARRTREGQLLAEIGEMREEVQHVSSFEGSIDELRASFGQNDPRPAATIDEADWDVFQP